MVYMTGLCHRSRSLLGGDLWVEAITYLKTQKEQGAECVWGSERDLTGDAEGDWAGQAIMGSLSDPTLTLGSHWGLKYRGWFWLRHGGQEQRWARWELLLALTKDRHSEFPLSFISRGDEACANWDYLWRKGGRDFRMDWVFVTGKGETGVYVVGLCGRLYSHPQHLCYCLQDYPAPQQMFQLQMCGPGLHLASTSPPLFSSHRLHLRCLMRYKRWIWLFGCIGQETMTHRDCMWSADCVVSSVSVCLNSYTWNPQTWGPARQGKRKPALRKCVSFW